MDIAEKRLPQDGRISLRIQGEEIDVRVSTMPTVYGESVSLRLLLRGSGMIGMEQLGLAPEDEKVLKKMITRPHGILLCTGPTGSGKSTSLYAWLHTINSLDKRIMSAEDPIEYEMAGVNQVQMKPEIGLTFAHVLRTFLRQDPDVIMVGEIRDLETAEIAIKAAQTGHLVLSTLHTNSAAETVTRMLNMGVPSFNLATSVSLIIAQRLARRLCKECSTPADIPQETLLHEGFTEEQLQEANIMHAVGCDLCHNGYKGRVGVYEVVRITPKISSIIMAEGNSLEIGAAARAEGFGSLRMSALEKVAQGVTTLEEVNRITTD